MSQSLFAGWRPGAASQERLASMVAALVDARPADAPRLALRRPDQWHATLCFIGHGVQHLVTPRLLGALAGVAAQVPPHAFTVERLAYWPGPGVVVALPHHCPPLQALCDTTYEALRGYGIAAMQVTAHPHITLAHMHAHLQPPPWLDAIDCSGGALRVEGFELLFNPGGRYASLGEWPLTGAAVPTPAWARS